MPNLHSLDAISSSAAKIMPDKRCRLRWSTKHLLAVYSQEFQSLKFFLGVGSSAARLGRAALASGQTGRCLAKAIYCRKEPGDLDEGALKINLQHLHGRLPILEASDREKIAGELRPKLEAYRLRNLAEVR